MPDADVHDDDEHVRYQAYIHALDDNTWKWVSELLHEEPDQSVATAVMVQILERADAGERRSIVNSSYGTVADSSYLERRANELDLVDQFTVEPVGPELRDLSESMLWVQRRVVESTNSRKVLQAMAKDGASKRVRRTAMDRLATMPQ